MTKFKTYDNANRYLFAVFQTRPNFQCMIGFWPSKAVKDREIGDIVKIDGAKMKKVVAIDFYRLIDSIDVNQKVTIDNYRFIEWSSDIGFIDCISRTSRKKTTLHFLCK